MSFVEGDEITASHGDEAFTISILGESSVVTARHIESSDIYYESTSTRLKSSRSHFSAKFKRTSKEGKESIFGEGFVSFNGREAILSILEFHRKEIRAIKCSQNSKYIFHIECVSENKDDSLVGKLSKFLDLGNRKINVRNSIIYDVENKTTPLLLNETFEGPYASYPGILPWKNTNTEIRLNLIVEVYMVSDVYRLQSYNNVVEDVLFHDEIIVQRAHLYYKLANFPDANVALLLVEHQVFTSDVLGVGGSAVSSYSSSDLIRKLNEWRNRNFANISPRHDVLHLMSGLDFNGNVVGSAYPDSVCDVDIACERTDPGYCFYDGETREYSLCCLRWAGAVNMASNNINDLSGAHTLAHEIGHQLGFSHDGSSDAVGCAETGNIMASIRYSNEDIFAQSWSSCTYSQFSNTLRTENEDFGSYNFHGYSCLLDHPEGTNLTELFGREGYSPDPSGAAQMIEYQFPLIFVLGYVVLSCFHL